MGTRLTKEQWAPIDKCILEDRKISALKKYRELTGDELQVSKDAIEGRLKRLREKFPEKFPAEPEKTWLQKLLSIFSKSQ